MGIKSYIATGILGALLSSCYSSYTIPNNQSVSVKIDAGIQDEGAGFSLIRNLNQVSVAINNCISGFTATLNIVDVSSVNLFEGDTGCSAEIVSFDLGGDIYTLQTGQTFQPAPGSLSLFSNILGNEVYVLVNSQLSSPISAGGESVSFSLIFLEEGSPLVINGVSYPVVSLMESLVTVTEGTDTQFSVPIEIVGDWQGDLLLDIEITGTASAGSDFDNVVMPLMIPSGTSLFSLNVALIDDSLSESMETIQLSILPGSSYVPSGSAMQVEIIDNDTLTFESLAIASLDDSGIQSTNGSVSAWTDDSQSGLGAYQDNPTQQPSLESDYLGAIDGISFDGSDDIMTIDISKEFNQGSPQGEKTVVFVMESGLDISRPQVIYEQGGDKRGFNIYIMNGRVYSGMYDSAKKFQYFFSSPIDQSTVYYLKFVYDVPNDITYFSVNGQVVGSGNNLIDIFSQGDAIGIGGINSKTRIHDGSVLTEAFFEGMIFESMFFNDALDNQTQLELDNYILDKYGSYM